MKDIIKIFKAVSDPVRMRIIKLLEQKKMCVCELTEIVGIGQPTVSHHLKILKKAGLVNDFRDGLWIIYALSSDKSNNHVSGVLKMITESLNDDPGISNDLKQAKSIDRGHLCGK